MKAQELMVDGALDQIEATPPDEQTADEHSSSGPLPGLGHAPPHERDTKKRDQPRDGVKEAVQRRVELQVGQLNGRVEGG
jgi:hypothetical protein